MRLSIATTFFISSAYTWMSDCSNRASIYDLSISRFCCARKGKFENGRAEQTKQVLEEVRAATGLAVSDVLKAGLRSLQERLRAGETARPPYEIYRELDLGAGGYAIAPATDVRSAVRRRLKAKHGR